jgi:hypothetical protein
MIESKANSNHTTDNLQPLKSLKVEKFKPPTMMKKINLNSITNQSQVNTITRNYGESSTVGCSTIGSRYSVNDDEIDRMWDDINHNKDDSGESFQATKNDSSLHKCLGSLLTSNEYDETDLGLRSNDDLSRRSTNSALNVSYHDDDAWGALPLIHSNNINSKDVWTESVFRGNDNTDKGNYEDDAEDSNLTVHPSNHRSLHNGNRQFNTDPLVSHSEIPYEADLNAWHDGNVDSTVDDDNDEEAYQSDDDSIGSIRFQQSEETALQTSQLSVSSFSPTQSFNAKLQSSLDRNESSSHKEHQELNKNDPEEIKDADNSENQWNSLSSNNASDQLWGF